MTTTVSALFDRYDDATTAVHALEAANVPRSEISIVAGNADDLQKDTHADKNEVAADAGIGAGIGAALGGAGGLLTGLGIMAIPGVGPVVAAGWLVATAAGAAVGALAGGAAGGIVGALTEAGVSEEDAHVYAEGVRRGGTLVTARVDDADAPRLQAVLDQNRSVDLTGRRGEYQTEGWTKFDETAPLPPRASIDGTHARPM